MFLALKKYPTSGYFMVIQDISGQQWQLTRYYHFLSQQLLWSTVYCNRQFFCVEWLLRDANPWNKAGVLICSLNSVVYQLVCGHCCKLLQWSTYIAEMALGVDRGQWQFEDTYVQLIHQTNRLYHLRELIQLQINVCDRCSRNIKIGGVSQYYWNN